MHDSSSGWRKAQVHKAKPKAVDPFKAALEAVIQRDAKLKARTSNPEYPPVPSPPERQASEHKHSSSARGAGSRAVIPDSRGDLGFVGAAPDSSRSQGHRPSAVASPRKDALPVPKGVPSRPPTSQQSRPATRQTVGRPDLLGKGKARGRPTPGEVGDDRPVGPRLGLRGAAAAEGPGGLPPVGGPAMRGSIKPTPNNPALPDRFRPPPETIERVDTFHSQRSGSVAPSFDGGQLAEHISAGPRRGVRKQASAFNSLQHPHLEQGDPQLLADHDSLEGPDEVSVVSAQTAAASLLQKVQESGGSEALKTILGAGEDLAAALEAVKRMIPLKVVEGRVIPALQVSTEEAAGAIASALGPDLVMQRDVVLPDGDVVKRGDRYLRSDPLSPKAETGTIMEEMKLLGKANFDCGDQWGDWDWMLQNLGGALRTVRFAEEPEIENVPRLNRVKSGPRANSSSSNSRPNSRPGSRPQSGVKRGKHNAADLKAMLLQQNIDTIKELQSQGVAPGLPALRQALKALKGTLKNAFSFFDLSGSRKVTYSEFSTGLKRLGVDCEMIAGMDTKTAFRGLNVKKTGALTFREFLGTARKKKRSEDPTAAPSDGNQSEPEEQAKEKAKRRRRRRSGAGLEPEVDASGSEAQRTDASGIDEDTPEGRAGKGPARSASRQRVGYQAPRAPSSRRRGATGTRPVALPLSAREGSARDPRLAASRVGGRAPLQRSKSNRVVVGSRPASAASRAASEGPEGGGGRRRRRRKEEGKDASREPSAAPSSAESNAGSDGEQTDHSTGRAESKSRKRKNRRAKSAEEREVHQKYMEMSREDRILMRIFDGIASTSQDGYRLMSFPDFSQFLEGSDFIPRSARISRSEIRDVFEQVLQVQIDFTSAKHGKAVSKGLAFPSFSVALNSIGSLVGHKFGGFVSALLQEYANYATEKPTKWQRKALRAQGDLEYFR